MAKSLFITATGTDVGKTYVTALIVKKLRDAGYDAGYYKAAMSGVEKTEQGLLSGDAGYAKQLCGLPDSHEELVTYTYENPVSPHLAGRWEGNPVALEEVQRAFEHICGKHEYIAVEGSGGILCPLRYDEGETLFLADMVRELGLSSLIVADAGLGTINAVVLTVEYMKGRDLPIKGILFNRWQPENPMHQDNRKMVEELTSLPVLAFVKDNDGELDIDAKSLAALYE